MNKKSILAILILTFIIGISGCTTKTASNGTFGEKSISINSILISNNTTAGNYTDDNGNKYFYIEGYLENNNSNDAFNVKVNANAYDANGNVIATNDSAYLQPSTIDANGSSLFYVNFNDSNSSIVRYEVKIVGATATM